MSLPIGSEITLDIEKPVAGGRMLARHDGQVVLAWGAIPGERVRARIERVGRGVLYADTIDVLTASPDRRMSDIDWRCGGNVFAHVAYERQLRLKSEIIRETCGRIGRLTLSSAPDVIGSPEQGYRMRARLHVRGGRIGFFREGTHDLCSAAATRQLLPETNEWIGALEQSLRRAQLAGGLAGLEIAENIRGDERACHLHLERGVDTTAFIKMAELGSLTGLSADRTDRAAIEPLAGLPSVSDILHVRDDDSSSALRLRRNVRAFFQANRFLLEALVRHVVSLVPDGPVVDLYAGVGLFGLSLAVAGSSHVTLIEGDPVSGRDLLDNAEPFLSRVRVERRSVEEFLSESKAGVAASNLHSSDLAQTTFIVDPPRTGMSKEALNGILRSHPAHIVYVSCDTATLARDARMLLDAGYELGSITGIDLFPNTAHVESIATFSR